MKKPIIIFIACLLVASCASKTGKKTEDPGDLYVNGVNFVKIKKYDKAIDNFNQIRENFPFDPLALVATVKLADVYFEQKKYLLATGIYEEFFKIHPEDENIPYVLSRLGECYEILSLTIDRDQNYTLKGIERYTYLKNRYPASTYAQAVDVKLSKLIQKLADRELYVGEFYYRTFQYNAAILRLGYFLKKYPDAKGRDLALYYLGASHKELGNLAKSEQYADTLRKDFPKSLYARIRIRERRTLQLAKAGVPSFQGELRKKRDIELRPQLAKVEEPEEKDKEEGFAFIDETKPIDIVSDSMEGYEKEKHVIFKGSVVAKQEDLFIFADVIDAFTNEETNEIDKAHAKGNVKIVKKERTATSNEAIFDNITRIITLKGNVIVFSGADKVSGELVTYYVNEDRVVVEGEKDKKARITITPR